MEANPYYLKDAEGGYYNKYHEFQVWEQGKQAGIKEVVDTIQKRLDWQAKNFENTPEPSSHTDWRHLNVGWWQAKLKEWGIEK